MKNLKRGMFVLLAVLICLSGFAGCRQWVYTSYVTETHYHGSKVNFGRVYQIWYEYGHYQNPDAPKELTIDVDGKSYTVTYEDSYKVFGHSNKADSYSGNGVKVERDSGTGHILYVSVWDLREGDHLLPEIEDPEGTAVKVADDVASQFINPLDYQRMVKYCGDSEENYGTYTITYTKTVGTLDTNDVIYVQVNSRGNLLSYSMGEVGKYDKLSPEDISLESVDDSIAAMFREKVNEQEGYKYISHEIREQILCYTPNGQYAIRSRLYVYCQKDELPEEQIGCEVTTVLTRGKTTGYEDEDDVTTMPTETT